MRGVVPHRDTKRTTWFFKFIQTKIRVCVGMDRRVWDAGGRNRKLDQAERVRTGPGSRGSGMMD